MERVFDDKRYTNEEVHTFLDVDGNLVMVHEEGVLPYTTGLLNKEAFIRTRALNREVSSYIIQKGTMGKFLSLVSQEPTLVKEVIF